MSADTLTLKLNGDDVPLHVFAEAIEHFNSLVSALSEEVAGDGLDWRLSALSVGSATATVRAWSDDVAVVEEVVQQFGVVGEHLHQRLPVPFSDAVAQPAYALTRILNGYVTSIDLATDLVRYQVAEPVSGSESEDRPGDLGSWGVVRGELATITTRPNLRVSVYDRLFDKAVTCFLNRRFLGQVREGLGRQVAVSGWVVRDGVSGRPLKVRQVSDVRVVDALPNALLQARGAYVYEPGSDPPEDIIRRLRDGIE